MRSTKNWRPPVIELFSGNASTASAMDEKSRAAALAGENDRIGWDDLIARYNISSSVIE